MNEEKKRTRKELIKSNRYYGWLKQLTNYLDRYYLDAALGFAIPGGIGDAITAIISIAYVLFSAIGIRSFPLTLAILNNTLRDLLLGLIPFYVGDVIDVFHKSNVKNMQLIEGFVEEDPVIVTTVKKKATYSVILFICLCIMIYIMFRLAIAAAKYMFSLF